MNAIKYSVIFVFFNMINDKKPCAITSNREIPIVLVRAIWYIVMKSISRQHSIFHGCKFQNMSGVTRVLTLRSKSDNSNF